MHYDHKFNKLKAVYPETGKYLKSNNNNNNDDNAKMR